MTKYLLWPENFCQNTKHGWRIFSAQFVLTSCFLKTQLENSWK